MNYYINELEIEIEIDMIRARNLSPDTVLARDRTFREISVPVSKGKSFQQDGKTVLITLAVADEALKRIGATACRISPSSKRAGV